MRPTDHADSGPLRIISAETKGIVLSNGNEQWCEPWTASDEVTVGRVSFGFKPVVVACVGIDSERVVMVRDTDPNWRKMMDQLHTALGCEHVEGWCNDPGISAKPRLIYLRQGSFEEP